jgi:acyl-coenzyme A synthetase/AMP-(fatty) acid ligase
MFVDQLPKSPAGKILKREIRKSLESKPSQK